MKILCTKTQVKHIVCLLNCASVPFWMWLRVVCIVHNYDNHHVNCAFVHYFVQFVPKLTNILCFLCPSVQPGLLPVQLWETRSACNKTNILDLKSYGKLIWRWNESLPHCIEMLYKLYTVYQIYAMTLITLLGKLLTGCSKLYTYQGRSAFTRHWHFTYGGHAPYL